MLLTMRAHLEALHGHSLPQRRGIDLARAQPDEAVHIARSELVDLPYADLQGVGADVGVEVASLAVQVHGEIGYIEETGIAEHYRDIRIAPIYKGTNEIQAINLVSRKIGLRGGGAVADFLAGIDTTAVEASTAGGSVGACSGNSWSGHWCFCTTRRRTRRGAWRDDPDDALAGRRPTYDAPDSSLGGIAVRRVGDRRRQVLRQRRSRLLPPGFLEQRCVTARSPRPSCSPEPAGLLPAVAAGPLDLFAAAFSTAAEP